MSEAIPTVYIVDDDPSFLKAIARFLTANGFEVKTFSSASEFLAHRDSDDSGCVVTDLQMPDMDGLSLQTAMAASSNPLPFLFLTGLGNIHSSVQAMRGGAEDFLEKQAPQAELLDAVTRALFRDARERKGRVRQLQLRALFDSLTTRELEVLSHVLEGRLNKQMASDLGINERTVKLHRSAIMRKMGVRSVAALARLSEEAGVQPTLCRQPAL